MWPGVVRSEVTPLGGGMSVATLRVDGDRAAPACSASGQADAALAPLTTPEGFRAFYDNALPQVFAHLLRRCDGDRGLAEDLTQETFLVAARKVREGRADQLSVPWLVTVAQNKFLDHLRRRRREERNLVVAWQNGEHDELRRWRHERDRGLACEAVEELPASQRAALLLFYLEDLTVVQTAARLGKGVHATESLLARGRLALRQRLAQEVPDA